MCGRFTLALNAEGLQLAFPWLEIGEKIVPRYNIAPTQPVAVVANDGKRRLDFFLWGLIPFWAKDPKIGSRMINARSETADEKKSFKASLKYRRCLILSDGFYEWGGQPAGKKVPYHIKLASGIPFVFAGLWDRWHSPFGDEILSCTILTTEANSLIRPIHDRMPVILEKGDYDHWLEEKEQDPSELKKLLKPYPPDEMALVRVSELVNNVRVDSPECLLPDPQGTLFE